MTLLKPSSSLLLAASLLCLPAAGLLAQTAAAPAPVQLHWLDQPPGDTAQGVSWGVAWPQGAVHKDTPFHLEGAQGVGLPLQAWPLAYWPDGSLKWTGFATVAAAGQTGPFTLAPGPAAAAGPQIQVTPGAASVVVDTGALRAVLPLSGRNLVESLRIGGREIARDGQLVCILQDGPETNPEDSPKKEQFLSLVRKVTVEQSGPVRAVVKIEGVHQGASGRAWLPFTVRLYFYAGQTAIRLVHTIVFDGDQEKDFIRGLGLRFAVPLREQVQNRTVRFAGEDGGLWSEPLQPGGGNAAQEAGQPFAGRGILPGHSTI